MTDRPWYEPLQAAAADYAASAVKRGEEAGAGLMLQLAGALTRLQALPEDAAATISELTGLVIALFPDDLAHGPIPSHEPDTEAACAITDGQAGAIAGTIRPEAGGVPRRWQVDPAGLARFLRAQHPVKPAEHAAARTGIPVETVAKLLARETLPVGRTLLAFIVAYGPDLLAAVLPGAEARWLAGARILADQARLEAELERTRAAMAANAGRWSFCGIQFGAAP